MPVDKSTRLGHLCFGLFDLVTGWTGTIELPPSSALATIPGNEAKSGLRP